MLFGFAFIRMRSWESCHFRILCISKSRGLRTEESRNIVLFCCYFTFYRGNITWATPLDQLLLYTSFFLILHTHFTHFQDNLWDTPTKKLVSVFVVCWMKSCQLLKSLLLYVYYFKNIPEKYCAPIVVCYVITPLFRAQTPSFGAMSYEVRVIIFEINTKQTILNDYKKF